MSDATRELVRMVSTWYDLLATLEMVLGHCEDPDDTDWELIAAEVRGAIRKAKGGS